MKKRGQDFDFFITQEDNSSFCGISINHRILEKFLKHFCPYFTFLSHEKLAIIYANIRV